VVNLGARAKHRYTDDTTEPMDNWDQIITQNASQQTLEAFLAPLNLGTDRNYSQFLISIGYGDVNEFGRFDQEDRKTFEMLAIDKGMEDWKAFKISRNMKHFAKAHQSGWLVGDEQGGTQPLYAPPPAQPQAGSSPQQDGAPPAAPQPPGATEPEEQRKRLHAERVKEWLAGTPGGNRPVYGRDNGSLQLFPWQIALNEAACRLAIEQPWLVRCAKPQSLPTHVHVNTLTLTHTRSAPTLALGSRARGPRWGSSRKRRVR